MTKYTIDQLERIRSCPWLTDRERKVAELVCFRGWYQVDAAAELYLSVSTIKRTIKSILHKIGLMLTPAGTPCF